MPGGGAAARAYRSRNARHPDRTSSVHYLHGTQRAGLPLARGPGKIDMYENGGVPPAYVRATPSARWVINS